MDDIIIIGSGAAGLTAAVYALRAGKTVRVFENNTFGGQINFAPKVENFPSIKQISGSEFASNLLEQAMDLGLVCEYSNVSKIEKAGKIFSVVSDDKAYPAKAVIIATGVKHKRLLIEREDEFAGEGVSYCAVCDGAFFTNRTAAVIGGGDTAFQEAIFLSAMLERVYLLHRRDCFRAEQRLIDAAKKQKNITIITNAQLSALIGEKCLEAIDYKDKLSGEIKRLEVSAVFAAIGHEPQNAAFADTVRLDSHGYIEAGEDCKTNVDGILLQVIAEKKL